MFTRQIAKHQRTPIIREDSFLQDFFNEWVAEGVAFNHRDFNVQLGSKLTNGGYSASFFTAVDYIENPLRTKSFFRIILRPDIWYWYNTNQNQNSLLQHPELCPCQSLWCKKHKV